MSTIPNLSHTLRIEPIIQNLIDNILCEDRPSYYTMVSNNNIYQSQQILNEHSRMLTIYATKHSLKDALTTTRRQYHNIHIQFYNIWDSNEEWVWNITLFGAANWGWRRAGRIRTYTTTSSVCTCRPRILDSKSFKTGWVCGKWILTEYELQ